jgi:hypothetical protein
MPVFRSWLYRIIGGLIIVAGSFAATLWVANYFSPLCPQGSIVAMSPPFAKFGSTGVAYIAVAPSLDETANSVDNPRRSPMLVCENSHLLGPAHSVGVDIAEKGGGRFTHWRGIGFIFSASDGTDPNANGRKYWSVRSP